MLFPNAQKSRQVVYVKRYGRLYEDHELKLYRGKVSQRGLQRILGLPDQSLNSSSKNRLYEQARRCIANFDKYLHSCGHGTVWEEKIPQIEAYLEIQKKAKTLPVNRSGDLDRTAVMRQFGMGRYNAGTIQKRAPRVKAVLDRYDITAKDPTYSQYKYTRFNKELKLLLKDPGLSLTYDRFVNLKWLSERLGIPVHALQKTPQLKALVVDKEREIDRLSRKGETQQYFRINGVHHLNIGAKPYSDKHNRIFNFSHLIDCYGLNFTEKAATVFVSLISNLVDPKAYYHRIIHFLLWLANESHLYGEIVEGLKNNKHIDGTKFERAIFYYKEAIQFDLSKKDNSRKSSKFELVVLQKFADAGVFPQIRIPGKKRKNVPRAIRPRPSLAEAKRRHEDTKNIAQLMDTTSAHFNVKLDMGEDTIAFAENLAREINQREDLPKDLSQAVCVMCDERLTALRVSASKTFESWREQYELGRQLISRSHGKGHAIYRKLQNAKASKSTYKWNNTAALLFPRQNTEIALCNLLSLVDECFDAICPLATTHEWGHFWTKLYEKVGVKNKVQSFLSPPSLVASAVICLYLCETGANESVAISMEAGAIRPSNVPNHLTIVGNKARSKGKAIYEDLPLKDTIDGCTSAAEAMSYYQSATDRYRKTHTEQTKQLFLYIARSKVRHIAEWNLREDMLKISTDSKELSTLKITPSLIRPTLLLMEHLKNPMNLGVTRLRARHEKEGTTFGYVGKLPLRLILTEKIREFQDTIQVIAVSGLKDARNKLSIEPNDWVAASDRVQRTGLGTFCFDPESGAQPDYPKGNKCQALDRCLTCPLKIVVAEPQSIADMIIWKKSLESAEGRFLDERYERWVAVWMPWQAFIQVVLDEKMTRGELANIKMKAQKIANSRMQSKDFKLPMPW